MPTIQDRVLPGAIVDAADVVALHVLFDFAIFSLLLLSWGRGSMIIMLVLNT